QNVVEIQDQALATVFTAEFEEMWGSSADTPASGTSRFGARKRDDTPHRVNVAGTLVDVHFSPSDRTTDYLRRTIASAGRSAYFCILTFTRDDLADVFIGLVRAGKTVRGVFDNDTDQGTEYPALRAAGADVLLKKNISGLLHHKYLIVDADAPDASTSAVVVTGSHNWSNAAEFWNNENTVGIHSANIARQYIQEWYKRYRDAGGTAAVVLGTGSIETAVMPVTWAVFPNPVSAGGVITLRYDVGCRGEAELAVCDLLGRTVVGPVSGMREPGVYEANIGLGGLPAGMYMCRVTTSSGGRRFVPFVVR
ncbi:MAG: phospholipase D-like domain-containing protein, partial [Bacteroidota bacterium]|nr:phospholipase D-like domain-containing protein [Bacteroidota bacterium]